MFSLAPLSSSGREKAKKEAEWKAQKEAEAKAQKEAETKAAEAKAQKEAEAKAQKEAEAKAQKDAEWEAKKEADVNAAKEVLAKLDTIVKLGLNCCEGHTFANTGLIFEFLPSGAFMVKFLNQQRGLIFIF